MLVDRMLMTKCSGLPFNTSGDKRQIAPAVRTAADSRSNAVC